MKTFIINWSHLSSLDDFYSEIEELFINDEKMIFWRNLDALNDVLWWWFWVTSWGEEFTLIWKNFDASSKNIKNIDVIEKIINENKHIKFIKA